MPEYEIGGESFRRKNWYMPCVMSAAYDDMTDVEKVQAMKKTYWADFITGAEWPVVLRNETATAPNKSRLKKKAAGWVMALGRITYLNTPLAVEIFEQAEEMWRDQIGETPKWERVAAAMALLSGADMDAMDDMLQTIRNRDAERSSASDSTGGHDE